MSKTEGVCEDKQCQVMKADTVCGEVDEEEVTLVQFDKVLYMLCIHISLLENGLGYENISTACLSVTLH